MGRGWLLQITRDSDGGLQSAAGVAEGGVLPWDRQSDLWRGALSSGGLSIARAGSRAPRGSSWLPAPSWPRA